MPPVHPAVLPKSRQYPEGLNDALEVYLCLVGLTRLGVDEDFPDPPFIVEKDLSFRHRGMSDEKPGGLTGHGGWGAGAFSTITPVPLRSMDRAG